MPLPPPDIVVDQAVEARVQLETLQGLLGTPTPGRCMTSSRFDAATRAGYAGRADVHLRTFLRLSAGAELGGPGDWIRQSASLSPDQREKVAALFTTLGETLCLAGSLEEGIQWQVYAQQVRSQMLTPIALGSAHALASVTLTFKASPSVLEAPGYWDGLEVLLVPPSGPGSAPELLPFAARANDWLRESRRGWPYSAVEAGGRHDQALSVTLHLSPGAYGLELRTSAQGADPPERPENSLATTAPPAIHTARDAWLCEANLLGAWSCRPTGPLPLPAPGGKTRTPGTP